MVQAIENTCLNWSEWRWKNAQSDLERRNWSTKKYFSWKCLSRAIWKKVVYSHLHKHCTLFSSIFHLSCEEPCETKTTHDHLKSGWETIGVRWIFFWKISFKKARCKNKYLPILFRLFVHLPVYRSWYNIDWSVIANLNGKGKKHYQHTCCNI